MRVTNFVSIAGKKIRPTLKHRAAMWEGMFGAVYAMNDQGVIRYWDYDYEGAKVWAGITNERDIRIFKCPRSHRIYRNDGYVLNENRRAVFILK